MHKISAGAAGYLIDAVSALTQYEDARVIRDSDSALNVLRQCVGDLYAMRMLRTLVSEVQLADVNHLNDVEVVEVVAGLVVGNRLWLVGPTPRLRAVDELATSSAAPASAAVPATRAAAPPMRSSAPSETAEPSFMADLDAALLAGMLKDASKDGTPFCEECARAARAA